MASDNRGFVDTESKSASSDVGSIDETVDTAVKITAPSGADEKKAATASRSDSSEQTKEMPVVSGDSEDPNSSRQPKTPEGNSRVGDDDTSGPQLRVTAEKNGLRKRRSIDLGTDIEKGSWTNGKTVNGSISHANRENVGYESPENGKTPNGLNGSVLNGSPPIDAMKNPAMLSNGSSGRADSELCERGGGGGGGGDAARPNVPTYPPGEAGRMLRNAIGVGVVFMVHFTATLGVTHLQSSVNKESGLGTSALAAQYAGLVISSLVLSVFLISKLGCKWTIVVAILCNVPYMGAQMYPRTYTLVPAAFVMGLAVAPLWSAKCTYLCVVAEARAALTGRALSAVRDRVIGLFFMIFLLSMVWGNLVSSLVLSKGERNSTNASVSGMCGVDFCPNSDAANENPNLERPPQEKIIVIISIYLGFMLLAALVGGCYVDSLKRYSEGSRASSATGLSTRGLLTATLALHRRKEMLLLIPLSVWLGIDYAFVEAEYTASFVACAWGIQNIGYVIICYGLANSALALGTGWLVARFGRRLVLCTGAVLHAALMAGVLAWRPSSEHKVLFFVVAALWGAADGHWCVQLNSLYAILFPNMEEAAYSNFRLWQSIGFVIAFSYSHYLCTVYKLYIVIALLVVGVAGYLGIEYTRPEKARLADG